MGGPCNMAFKGVTAEEVGKKGGEHIMVSTDEAHKSIREQMVTSSKAEQDKWWVWFKGEWDKKTEA